MDARWLARAVVGGVVPGLALVAVAVGVARAVPAAGSARAGQAVVEVRAADGGRLLGGACLWVDGGGDHREVCDGAAGDRDPRPWVVRTGWLKSGVYHLSLGVAPACYALPDPPSAEVRVGLGDARWTFALDRVPGFCRPVGAIGTPAPDPEDAVDERP